MSVLKLPQIRIEGLLRKKGQHVNLWRERYFMIRKDHDPRSPYILCYYRKKGDKQPRDYYVLSPETQVDLIRESPSKIETKKLFTFRISNYASIERTNTSDAEDGITIDYTSAVDPHSTSTSYIDPRESGRIRFESTSGGSEEVEMYRKKQKNIRRTRAIASAAVVGATTAVVLTGGLAGIGMVGMAGMGAAAGGMGAFWVQKGKKGTLALAAESREVAEWWRENLLDCIAHNEGIQEQFPCLELNCVETEKDLSSPSSQAYNRRPSVGSIPRFLLKNLRSDINWSSEATFEFLDFCSGLRILQEISCLDGGQLPTLRTSSVLSCSPFQAFELLMNLNSCFYRQNHVIRSARIVQQVDNHVDIIQLVLHPFHRGYSSFPSVEMCLSRYWRKEEDGSFVICFQSNSHQDCPLTDCTRAKFLGGGFIIAPRIEDSSYEVEGNGEMKECRVIATCQIDDNSAWYLRNRQRTQIFGSRFLEQLAGAQSLLEWNNDDEHEKHRTKENSPSAFELGPLQLIPCSLPPSTFARPSQEFFPDKDPIFSISAADFFQVPNKLENIALQNYSRLQQISESFDTKQFVLILNFQIPGPPMYSMVLYFVMESEKLKEMDNGLKRFFHSDDDDFRDASWEIQVELGEGPWIMKKAFGSQAVMLGKKVAQTYTSGEEYFEIDCDISTSAEVAGLAYLLQSQMPELVLNISFHVKLDTLDHFIAFTHLDHISMSYAQPLPLQN